MYGGNGRKMLLALLPERQATKALLSRPCFLRDKTSWLANVAAVRLCSGVLLLEDFLL